MSQTHSAKPFLSVFNDSIVIDASTPAQKRALSYATTIEMLFNQVMNSKMPADRIIGQYFREHKKHGSKDRRVIRESLFGLFRCLGAGVEELMQECELPKAEAELILRLHRK